MAGVSNHGTQSDLVLRDSGTGGLEIYNIYNISNNQITGAAFLGSVGLDWQPSGFGGFQQPQRRRHVVAQRQHGRAPALRHPQQPDRGRLLPGQRRPGLAVRRHRPSPGPGTSDLVLRNVNTGALQVYNIAGNTLVGSASLGAAGLDWQLGGFAADRPTGAMGSADDSTSPARASDGGVRRRQRHGRRIECRLRQCRRVPAAVVDDPAARVRAAGLLVQPERRLPATQRDLLCPFRDKARAIRCGRSREMGPGGEED
jgi:hypothetical protein